VVSFQAVKDELLALQLEKFVRGARRRGHIVHFSIPADEDDLVLLFRIWFNDTTFFHSLALDLPLLNEGPDLFLKILKHALRGLGPLELLPKLLGHFASSLSGSSFYNILLSSLLSLLACRILLRVPRVPERSEVVWDSVNRVCRLDLPVGRLRRLGMWIANKAIYSQKPKLVFQLLSKRVGGRSWHEPFSHRLR